METILNTLKTNRVTVSDYEGESYSEIITLAIDMPERYGYQPYSMIKEAIQAMEYEIDGIRIPRPCSEYDCTGRPFTTGLEVIKRFVHGTTLVYVLHHNIAIDC